jgi:hypothetical protein
MAEFIDFESECDEELDSNDDDQGLAVLSSQDMDFINDDLIAEEEDYIPPNPYMDLFRAMPFADWTGPPPAPVSYTFMFIFRKRNRRNRRNHLNHNRN